MDAMGDVLDYFTTFDQHADPSKKHILPSLHRTTRSDPQGFLTGAAEVSTSVLHFTSRRKQKNNATGMFPGE